MQILPVIDLLNGQVVRGVAGNRASYRPIESRLTTDPSPESIATALVRQFGFRECYVADLDAIGGSEPNWDAYRAIARAGMRLWLDAGTGSVSAIQKLVSFDPGGKLLKRIVVGLESLDSVDAITDMVQDIGTDRCVFSLDLRAGQPLFKPKAWPQLSKKTLASAEATGGMVNHIIERAVEMGVTKMIVLDLASVGVGQGISTLALCREIHRLHPGIELSSGGGVRDIRDVQALETIGCEFALVASALHDGRISPLDSAASQLVRH